MDEESKDCKSGGARPRRTRFVNSVPRLALAWFRSTDVDPARRTRKYLYSDSEFRSLSRRLRDVLLLSRAWRYALRFPITPRPHRLESGALGEAPTRHRYSVRAENGTVILHLSL